MNYITYLSNRIDIRFLQFNIRSKSPDKLYLTPYTKQCVLIISVYSDLQAMMYVIAGFMHDLDHRGTTNSFHIHGRELTQCYLSRLKLRRF